jgi:uncharacterized protein YbjQ (UPF0145 family)
MTEPKNCPNCNAELKSGLLSSTSLLDARKTGIINEYHDKKSEGYCSKCGKDLIEKYEPKLREEKQELSTKLQRLIGIVPVISAHSPLDWKYRVLDMVTGQSTTGTGVISEFTSSFTDLFGAQSGRHNQKLKKGEDMCFAQLRKQALDKGGNAVIATDIDYSEIGGDKGMLMVCMAGTAVHLENIDVLGEQKAKHMDELVQLNQRIRHLNKYPTDN